MHYIKFEIFISIFKYQLRPYKFLKRFELNRFLVSILLDLQMNPNTLKQWLYRGEIEKLENVVLEGRGSRLLGERSPDLRTRVFLKGLPNYLVNISIIYLYSPL